MSKKSSAKEIIVPTITLFIIALISAVLLAGLNSLTDPIISENNLAAENESRQTVLPAAVNFKEKTTDDGTIYYEGVFSSGEFVGIVVTTRSKSYGGEISVMTGIDENGVVAGIVILQIEDTPGLGMKVKEDYFLNQFIGGSGSFKVTKNGVYAADGDANIDAISSATITSVAVTNAVNTALDIYNSAVSLAEQNLSTEPDANENSPTEPNITENNMTEEDKTRQKALPSAVAFNEKTTDDGMIYHEGVGSNGENVGMVFITECKSYHDTVKVMTGIDNNGTVTGVVILEINDTPGYGMNATEDYFLNQFIGCSDTFTVTKNGIYAEDANSEIDAISSATVTSAAVVNAVNAALEFYKSLA